ncbi:hypothetical protein ACFYY1_37275 [Streptomyces sp. NPDC001890]|uniref:hypothetical protein n=1 Tax=Streptomyces sp. NPDC001890 TaxID=3364620 RepID=UPI0036B9A4F1
MDSIALNLSDLTTPDRADRARKAWELYGAEHADGVANPIEDLIADLLHLADTDDHPGGAAGVASRAVRNYEAELATWPTERADTDDESEDAGRYLAQVRGAESDWLTVGHGDDHRTVASHLWKAMQVAGFRFSELAAHTEDLMEGHVLTSDDGFEFRVIERDEH